MMKLKPSEKKETQEGFHLMFNKELVEKISDDFESTFTFVNEFTLRNMTFEKEIPEIIGIISKYIPGKTIQVTQIEPVGPKYIYEFEIV